MKIITSPQHLDAYRRYVELEQATRAFLADKQYLPLTLPVLSPALVPESYLEVFATEYRFFNTSQSLYLTPSPELFMKRVLCAVQTDCYYLGKAFRNAEATSTKHSGEFVMLEYYRLGVSYLELADELLELLRTLEQVVGPINIDGKKVQLDAWERLTVDEAFVRYADVAAGTIFDEQALRNACKKRGYTVDGFSYEDLFSQLYVDAVEPHLGTTGRPTLIYDYPSAFAALAKLNDDGKTAQRFEFYIEGVELGDCYSELTDPAQQKARFEAEQAARVSAGRLQHPVDWGFVDALTDGLPACAGIAIGFERLAMVFLGLKSIHDLRLVDVV